MPKKVTAACIVPTGRMPALLYRRRNPVAEGWHQKTFYIECFICLCSMEQELKTEAPRKLILEKSFLKFYTQGFKPTSINEIMKTTRLSKGALYHNFKNKEELGVPVLKAELHERIYKLHPLPSLSTIIASRTRRGALGRPPPFPKSGSNAASSTRWAASRRNTLCQEAESSSILDLRSERWAPGLRNMSVCAGGVFLNIPEDRAFAGFCPTKNNVILSRTGDFSEWTQSLFFTMIIIFIL